MTTEAPGTGAFPASLTPLEQSLFFRHAARLTKVELVALAFFLAHRGGGRVRDLSRATGISTEHLQRGVRGLVELGALLRTSGRYVSTGRIDAAAWERRAVRLPPVRRRADVA